MSSLFSDDDGDDTKGAEERVGEEGLEARETAFPSRRAPDAYGSGTGGKKKKKKKKSDEKPKEPSRRGGALETDVRQSVVTTAKV